MNLWRFAGGLITLACLVLVGLQFPVQAAPDKDKDKKADKDKAKGKPDEKKAVVEAPKEGPEVKFDFKAFSEKKTFYQKLVTSTEQVMSVDKQGGQPSMKQTQDQTFIISWKPLDEKDGNYVVEQQIVYVKMNIVIGTTTIPYDSTTRDQPKNPMTEFFDALMKVKLTIYVKKADMTVTKVEGDKEFVEKLGDSHPQMKNLLKSILGPEAIKKMSEQTWAAIPTKAVKKGDSWTVVSELNMGAIGTYTNTYKYTLDSVDDKTAKFSVSPEMKYAAPKKVEKGEALPFEIKGTTSLSSEKDKSSGTVVFDIGKGRIASSTMTMEVKGNVDIDIGGMVTVVQLKQIQKSEMTSADTQEALMPKK